MASRCARLFRLGLSLTALSALGGCFLEQAAYFGNYDVACPDIGPATGWAGALEIPERVAARLGRPVEDLRANFPDTVRQATIARPRNTSLLPSILFTFTADYRLSIMVNAADPDADAATRAANQAVAEVLKASPCHSWEFRVGHYGRMFAERAGARGGYS